MLFAFFLFPLRLIFLTDSTERARRYLRGMVLTYTSEIIGFDISKTQRKEEKKGEEAVRMKKQEERMKEDQNERYIIDFTYLYMIVKH